MQDSIVISSTGGSPFLLSNRLIIAQDYQIRIHGSFGGTAIALEAWDGTAWVVVDGADLITASWQKIYNATGTALRVVVTGGLPNLRVYINKLKSGT